MHMEINSSFKIAYIQESQIPMEMSTGLRKMSRPTQTENSTSAIYARAKVKIGVYKYLISSNKRGLKRDIGISVESG